MKRQSRGGARESRPLLPPGGPYGEDQPRFAERRGGVSVLQHRYRISCEVDGKSYEGNYWVAGKILVVSTAKGGTSHQLGTNQPEALAYKLLRKLAAEGKA